MKKIIGIVLVATLFLSACNRNILNTTPNYAVSSSSMWTTDNLTDLGVNGVYSALRLGGSGSGNLLYELYSMDRYAYTGQDYYNDELTNGTATPTSGLFTTAWQTLYEGISRANDAIYNIPLKSPSPAAKKARYVAECKVLRAYFYFRLNELWNGIPVYLVPTQYDKFNHTAVPRDSVWQVIISDLTDAINEPNLPSFYSSGDANWGHVTKGTAYALRGMVYMWMHQWTKAIADFQQVQTAGYKLYTGSGALSYKMLFKQAQDECSEMIFSMMNVDKAGYGGTTDFYCGTRSSWGSCWDWYEPSNALVDLYENADGSPFNWDNVIPGYNEMTPAAREVFFIRDHATAAELSAAAGRGADIALYSPDSNEARIQRAYANRDPRLQQTVITPYATYLGAPIGSSGDLTYTWRWPYRNMNPPTLDIKADRPAYGLYWYRKFVYEGSSEGSKRDQVPTNYPIIRYAQVLLEWAEALNESQGVTQQGLDLVNQVRERAGMPDYQMTDPSKPTYIGTQDAFRQAIRNEIRVEFPNEGVDYFEELRWGTWLQNKFSNGNGCKEVWGTVLSPYVSEGNYITTWPVPTSVTQITQGRVPQTPGWTY